MTRIPGMLHQHAPTQRQHCDNASLAEVDFERPAPRSFASIALGEVVASAVYQMSRRRSRAQRLQPHPIQDVATGCVNAVQHSVQQLCPPAPSCRDRFLREVRFETARQLTMPHRDQHLQLVYCTLRVLPACVHLCSCSRSCCLYIAWQKKLNGISFHDTKRAGFSASDTG